MSYKFRGQALWPRKGLCYPANMGLRTLASLTMAAAMTSAIATPAAAGDVVRKPDLAVWGADGHFQGYSAALPLDLSTDAEKAMFTAKVAGAIDDPTYNFELNLSQKPDDNAQANRTVGLGASWNAHEAAIRSSLARSFGFGLLPKTNYVRLSMDMNATQPVYLRGRTPVTRANVRSELTLDGRPVASIALGGGAKGDEGFDVSLTRPFDIPAEFTVSLRAADERVQDGRLMVKLVRATW
uniref:Lipid/polyisoprenoid-binding YceI-like domain-containing protein n=1 Tax=Caulobacter sp. (strain K31) TaxID=366602 RepID=B0SWL2_CAUSK